MSLFLELVLGCSGRTIKMYCYAAFYRSSLRGLSYLACLVKLSSHLPWLWRGIWSVRLGTQRQADMTLTMSLSSLEAENCLLIIQHRNLLTLRVIVFF